MPKPPAANRNREPQSRSFVQWTPDLLRAAEVTADGGTLRLAADLCDYLRADGRVRMALETRARGLLKHKLSFQQAGDKRRSKKAVRHLEADEDWWSMVPEAELIALLGWGILLGVALARLEWEMSDSGRLLPRLTVRHPRHLRYDTWERRWLLSVEDGREIEITPGDREWVLYIPTAGPKPWANGAWKGVAPYVLGRVYGWSDWQQHSALHGSGVRFVEAEENVADDLVKKAVDDLGALRAGGVYGLPPGCTSKLSEATAKTWEMFPQQLSAGALEIAINLLGQNLSSEVTDNAGTGATLHAEVKADIVAGDGETVSTCLHDQVLVPWAEVNFADAGLAPWPFWPVITATMLTAKAAALKSFGEAVKALREALRGTGLGIGKATLQGLAEDHGLTLDEVEEAAAPPPAPPAAPPTGPNP